jgi:hypothetical protein
MLSRGLSLMQPATVTATECSQSAASAIAAAVFGVRVKILGLVAGGQPLVWDSFFAFDTVGSLQKTVRKQLNIARSL